MFKYEKWLHSYEDWVSAECNTNPSNCEALKRDLELAKAQTRGNMG
jgi:hypothetical protein